MSNSGSIGLVVSLKVKTGSKYRENVLGLEALGSRAK